MASESHNRKRGQIQAKLTKISDWFLKEDQSKISSFAIEERLKELAVIEDRFNEHQQKMYDNFKETDTTTFAQLEEEQKSHEDHFEDLMFKTKIAMKMKLSELTKPKQQIKTPTIDFKLPTVTLPTFSGKPYKAWIDFRDNFDAVIIKSELPPQQKMLYLVGALKGDAKTHIGDPQYTEQGFNTAWASLMARYNNTRVLIEECISELCNLSAITNPSADSVRALIDTVSSNLSTLRSLHQPVEHYDRFIVYLVTVALDPDSRQYWENSLKSDALPTWSELHTFLEQRFRVLESLHHHPAIKSDSKTKEGPSKPSNQKPPTKQVHSVTANSQSCVFCSKQHSSIFQCEKFKDNVDVAERMKLVQKHNACFNCLKTGHSRKDCTGGSCKHCHQKHHSLLHQSKQKPGGDDQEPPKEPPKQVSHASSSKQVLLTTAVVFVKDARDVSHKCRALLDNGAQSNFISESLVNILNLKRNPTFVKISGVNSSESTVKHSVNLTISSCSEYFSRSIDCLVVKQVTRDLPIQSVDISTWDIPHDAILADPNFNVPSKVDLLLAADTFYDAIKGGIIDLSGNSCGTVEVKLIETRFGWVLGGAFDSSNVSHTVAYSCVQDSEFDFSQLQDSIQNFWRLESIESQQSLSLSPEEKVVEDHFARSISRDTEGHYVVSLPLNESVNSLGESKSNAIRRFKQVESKLDKSPELKQMYSDFMAEYKSLGHMSVVSSENIPDTAYFIPHHFVLKLSSSTTKLRVVFDGSSVTSSGVSINDCLFNGSNVQPDLFSIILRFRLFQYVFSADLEKMYRMFLVKPEHRKFQMIVWRKDSSEPLQFFELNTVTYGLKSSAHSATRCLKQIGLDYESKFPLASHAILNSCYVDNFLCGSDNLENLVQVKDQLLQLFVDVRMRLRKFSSNSEAFIKSIPVDDLEQEINFKDSSVNEIIKSLGINWHPKTDTFTFSNVVKVEVNQKVTKCHVLSQIAQFYDPLGLISPIIISAKILMQRIWQSQIGWSDELLPPEKDYWMKFTSKLDQISNISINRCAVIQQSSIRELHGFCDASESGFGACIYIRSKDNQGRISSHLLCAKSRVSPLKKQTIPRLELESALLLSELVHKVINSLDFKIPKVTLWSDSTITLSWIRTPSYKLKTFPANRVARIQELTSGHEWKHIDTENNPADVVSRGVMPDELKDCSLWWHGPNFLLLSENHWPDSQISFENIEVPELKVVDVALLDESEDKYDLVNRYSSFRSLLHVTAQILRFKNNCIPSRPKRYGVLTPEELRNALEALIKCVQSRTFANEIKQLSSATSIVGRKNKLFKLCPIIQNGILKVGGRLERADLTNDQKHPMILSSVDHFTRILFKHEHLQNSHCGPQTLLNIINQKFWVVGGKVLANQTFHNCFNCFRVSPKRICQKMGELPPERVNPSRPFSISGVDLAGPFTLKFKYKRGKIEYDSYIALFICFFTKAVHLEVLYSLSAEEFVQTLKRFVSRRGKPSQMWSDNATNFTGTVNELERLQAFWKQEADSNFIASYCADQGITWKFIPPASPNFGGLWESNIRSMKSLIHRVTGKCILTFEEFATLVAQVEACINSRPLTEMSSDANDLQPLTPAHFLIGTPMSTILEPDLADMDVACLKQWKQVTKLSQMFFNEFAQQYFHTLQQRYKNQLGQENLKVGQLVLLIEEKVPSLYWRLGRIVRVTMGADGKVRVAHIKTKNGELTRAVSKIAPLPTLN